MAVPVILGEGECVKQLLKSLCENAVWLKAAIPESAIFTNSVKRTSGSSSAEVPLSGQ